jgi:hypothetical protein
MMQVAHRVWNSPDVLAREAPEGMRELSLVSDVSAAARPCFVCGHFIAIDDFLEWLDTSRRRFALCERCGAPNEQHDTDFVVLDRSHASEPPDPVTDVFPAMGGGWQACCECGLAEAVDTQAAGWSWVLDHRCKSPSGQPIQPSR